MPNKEEWEVRRAMKFFSKKYFELFDLFAFSNCYLEISSSRCYQCWLYGKNVEVDTKERNNNLKFSIVLAESEVFVNENEKSNVSSGEN